MKVGIPGSGIAGRTLGGGFPRQGHQVGPAMRDRGKSDIMGPDCNTAGRIPPRAGRDICALSNAVVTGFPDMKENMNRSVRTTCGPIGAGLGFLPRTTGEGPS
ncbi:MAG: hypothetical protein IRY89_09640 [Pseudolabrys sp.]|nr:hypothetical protein [Pseudolabrys sp.]